MTDRLAVRRQELVEAAFAVFAEQGYHPAGVADIVKHAGVSHGTFYNYFDNKRDILDAVIDFGVERLIGEVVGDDRPGGAQTKEEFAGQFRAILGRLFDVIEREPKLVEFVMLEAPAIDDDLVQRLFRSFATFAALTTEYVHDGVRHGYFQPDIDTEVTSEALLSLMLSVLLLRTSGPVSQEERGRHIDALVDLATRGVLA